MQRYRLSQPKYPTFVRPSSIGMRHNISEVKAVIEDRRTVRPEHFSSRKVHKEIVLELLNAARWAPTHRYTQPWHFTVFMGESLKRLSDFQSELYRNSTRKETFKQEKFDKLLDRPLSSSVVIGIGMKKDEAGKNPEIEEVASVAIAVQNMMLLATAHGIGSYWNTGGVTYKAETKDFMGLNDDDKFLGFLYLGYPKEEWPRNTRRKPQEYFTDWRDG